MRSPVLALALVVVAGCGGGGSAPSATEQVKTTLKDYLRLQANGAPAQACSLLSASAQAQLTALVEEQARTSPLGGGDFTCEQSIGVVRVVAGAELLGAMRDASVEDVKVTGDDATAVVVGAGEVGRQSVDLVREGEHWKISAVPNLGG